MNGLLRNWLRAWFPTYLPRWHHAATLVLAGLAGLFAVTPRGDAHDTWFAGALFGLAVLLSAVRARLWWTRVGRPHRRREADRDERFAAPAAGDGRPAAR